jgi:two-component system, OmpR family, alkaline phosphatase synthesis response regulator PhoP
MSREQPRILVVDDEVSVVNLISYNLKKEKFDVLATSNGLQGLEIARRENPDLILLDLMLPGMDGLQICRELRKDSQVPIIMITARGEEIDRVVGLEIGADDYLCKPFSMRELTARVKAVLRRAQPAPAGSVDPPKRINGLAGLWMDAETREAGIDKELLGLTRLEFDLLFTLLRHKNQVLTRERLLEDVWGFDYCGDSRAVDSAVKRLRAALRTIDPHADRVEAVRGIGYKYDGSRNESQP